MGKTIWNFLQKKLGCVNYKYVLLVFIISFVLFNKFFFLPGNHYEDGHFLALINDEDVKVLHSLGYGIDENDNQLYSDNGLPIFKKGKNVNFLDKSIGYSFNSNEILEKIKKRNEESKKPSV